MNKIPIIIYLLLVGQFLIAQVSDTIKDLPAEQVEVIKQFEARLTDAKKVNVVPEPPAQRVLEKFDYQVSVRPLLLEYPEPSIRPVAVSPREKPQKSNGLIRIAAGNLNTVDAGFSYNFISRQETEIDFSADYLTMNNKKERFQQIQQIGGELALSHTINSLVAFTGNIGYSLDDVGFYGSPLTNDVVDTSIYFRRLSDYNIGFKVFNAQENEFDLNYSLGFDFMSFTVQNEGLMENNLVVDGRLEKLFNENFVLSLAGKVDISSITDTSTFSYNNYILQPGISYNSEFFKLNAGVAFGFAAEKTHYLPKVELAFSPYDYRFVPFAYWKGSLQKNNVIRLYDYNPYMSNNSVSEFSNSVHMRYGIGVRGDVKNLSYETYIAYGKTDDLILFRNVINDQGIRQFDILKDTANVLEVGAHMGYQINEDLNIDINFALNDYSIIAWHLPTYTFDVDATYYLLDRKLKLNPSLYVRDGVRVLNDEGSPETLPYMLDFNFHSSYKVREQFSIYAEVNNILSSEYQQWYDYSNFGINAKAGLKVKF